MTDALRYEWTRIRTLRSTYWLAGLGILVSAAVAVIVVIADDDPDVSSIGALMTGGANFAIPFIAIFIGIVGVLATGHEYRYGTIQPTLTAIPQRSPLLVAKIIVVIAAALAVVVLSMGINALIGLVGWAGLTGIGDAPLNAALLGYVTYVLLYAVLGLALGQLFRGVPSALVVLFVVPLVVETLIIGLSNVPALDWMIPVVKFLPFNAGAQLMATQDPDYGPNTEAYEFFDRWASGGVFAAFVAIILAVAWYLFQKRDA